jgi:hypothetical protein
MSIVYPTGYYDRTDPNKRFDKHLFRANHIFQSAEANEIQEEANARIKGIGDVLFRDGAPANFAQIAVNSSTGATAGDAGVIYAGGKLYPVPSASFTLSTTGTVSVGVYLLRTIVNPEDDADLYDPAIEAGSFQEPGASRLKTVPSWGYAGDGQDGDFYSIYKVIDGLVQPYTPPPDISPISQAIARYDRQSTGSNYISNGLEVRQIANDGDDQVFLIMEGVARLQGKEIDRRTSFRAFFPEEPDLETVIAETRQVTSDNPFTVTVNRPPISSVTLITGQKTITGESLTKAVGDYDSVAKRDSLVSMTSVWQGTTTYENPADYTLTDSGDAPVNRIKWAGGAKPSNGTTFYVTYAYTAQYPDDLTILASSSSTYVAVADLDEGTNVAINYNYKVPRYDRLCLDMDGQAVLVTGISHPDRPMVPSVPRTLLPLAIIHQTWIDATRKLYRDGVRMVPMAEIETMNRRIDDLTALVADCRSALYGMLGDPNPKRGLFTDSLYSDEMRDTGLDQTAIIDPFTQTLMCGVEWTATPHQTEGPTTLIQGDMEVLLSQPLKTNWTLINPYQSFTGFILIPPQVKLFPSIDTWTVYRTIGGEVGGPIHYTQYAQGSVQWRGMQQWLHTGQTAGRFLEYFTGYVIVDNWQMKQHLEVVGHTRTDLQYLREITVRFEIDGLNPGEPLQSVTFDGLTVEPRATYDP